MKIRFLLACLTFGLLNNASAQQDNFISNLIDSKNFAFVVSKVEKKTGLNGSSGIAPYINIGAINPSTTSMYTSKEITTNAPVTSFVLSDYYQLAAGDGSYFNAYNIKNKQHNPEARVSDNFIFLVQQPDKLLLTTSKRPQYTGNGSSEELKAYTPENFKLVSKKKKDNGWLLKYKVGKRKDKRVFYLEVDQNGHAVLQDQPSEHNTNIMYGNILRTSNK
jgi:hypothetical protein